MRQERDEIALVHRSCAFGLVQQLDVGPDVRDAFRARAADVLRARADVAVSAVDPAAVVALLDEDLELPLLLSALARPELMRRRRQRAAPRCEGPLLGDEVLPPLQVRAQLLDVAAEDRDLDVVVRARRVPDEQIEGPSAGDPPRDLQAAHEIGDLLRSERLPLEQLGRRGAHRYSLTGRRTAPHSDAVPAAVP